MTLSFDSLISLLVKNGRLSPFHHDFTQKYFEEYFSPYQNRDKKANAVLQVIIKLYDYRVSLERMILQFLTEINLTDSALINLSLNYLNSKSIENYKKTTERLKGVTPQPNFESLSLTIENFYSQGLEENISNPETQVDIFIEFIHQINNRKKNFPEINPAPEANSYILDSRFDKIWAYCSVIHNLKYEVYARVVYDNCEAVWDNTQSLTITQPSQIVEFARTAGRLRSNSHQLQTYSALKRIDKKSTFTKVLRFKKIALNEVCYTITEPNAADHDTYLHTFSFLAKYHFYLSKYPIASLHDITPDVILSIVSIIISIANAIMVSPMPQSLEKVPVFFSRAQLLRDLALCVEINLTTIDTIINLLTSDLNNPELWKKPFILQDNKLYFPIFCLTAPNIHLFLDNIFNIDAEIKKSKVKLFKESIISDLNLERPKYEFELIKPEASIYEDDLFDTVICIRTKDVFLVMETVNFSFPILYSEHQKVKIIIANKSYELQAKISIIIEKLSGSIKERKILSALICDYPNYSGLIVNEVPIVDSMLLNNYFQTGELTRVMSKIWEQNDLNDSVSRLKYYVDEASFNIGIENFLTNPPPIRQLMEIMKLDKMNIIPTQLNLQIYIPIVDHLDEEEIYLENVRSLDSLMTYHFLSEPALLEESAIENTVNFDLSNLIHRIAYKPVYDIEERLGLIEAATRSKYAGQSYFMRYLMSTASESSYKRAPHISTFDFESIEESILPILERLEPYIKEGVAFSDFEMPKIFSENEERRLISISIDFINFHAYSILTDSEVNEILLYLSILKGYSSKYNIKAVFYTACINFIDLLNNSHHYQKARDFSEELLLVSIRTNNHFYGWLVLFNCYLGQNNFLESLLYGSLVFCRLKHDPHLDHQAAVDSFYALLRFLRNFDFHEYIPNIYNALVAFELSDVEFQKVSNVYFYSRLKIIDEKPQSIEGLFSFLDSNIEKIIQRGTEGCVPWLAILYNLLRLKEQGQYHSKNSINDYIDRLERESAKDTYIPIRSKILGTAQNKMLLIDALKQINETRSSRDLVNELKNLTLLVEHVIAESLQTGETEGLLLSSLVLSDPTLTYKEQPQLTGRHPLVKKLPPGVTENLLNYQNSFLKKIELKNGQTLIWIFHHRGGHTILQINSQKQIAAVQLPQWSKSSLNNWIADVTLFYFNNKNNANYDLNAQEQDYQRCLKKFQWASIPLTTETLELFVCSAVSDSIMPHNLLVMHNNFIADQIPICNVISPEYFVSRSSEVILPEKYSISAWIPIENGNHQIEWGFSLLEPVLTSRNAIIETSHYPTSALTSDINVFLAHGIREITGFKAVRTSNDPRSSILHLAEVFGKGKIAILFICNSGSLNEEVYSMKVVSLCTDILELGYESVIAPAWPYDVTMCGRWLDAFLKHIDTGHRVNMAVFLANQSLGEYDPATSSVFLAPEGKFALHLYGNPNVLVKKLAPSTVGCSNSLSLSKI